MKRLVLLSALACVVLLGSCTREYTCVCVIEYSGQPALPKNDTLEYSVTDKKDAAKSLCEKNSGTYDTDDYGNTKIHAVETCHLY